MAAIIGLDDARIPELSSSGPRPTACSASRTGTRRARSSCPASAPPSRPPLEIAKELGAKRAIELPVSVAAHSPLMAEAAAGMREVLAGITFHEPRRRSWPTPTRAASPTADGCRAGARGAPHHRRRLGRRRRAHDAPTASPRSSRSGRARS